MYPMLFYISFTGMFTQQRICIVYKVSNDLLSISEINSMLPLVKSDTNQFGSLLSLIVVLDLCLSHPKPNFYQLIFVMKLKAVFEISVIPGHWNVTRCWSSLSRKIKTKPFCTVNIMTDDGLAPGGQSLGISSNGMASYWQTTLNSTQEWAMNSRLPLFLLSFIVSLGNPLKEGGLGKRRHDNNNSGTRL